MIDRTLPPAFGKIEDVPLMEPKLVHLDNGIPVFCIDVGIQNVLKVELAFESGSAHANKLLVASSTAKLLTDGTSKHTAAQIAQAVDYFGAYLQTHVDHDETTVDLFTLNKHLKSTIKILSEIYQDPVYPEKELQTHIRNGQQELMVNEQKVSYLAAQGFNAALYGKDHPYGRSASVEDYARLTQSDLRGYYQEKLHGRVHHILIAGKLRDDTLPLLNEYFGNIKRDDFEPQTIEVEEATAGQFQVDKPDAVQNAIRVGRVLFGRDHPDFIGMQIVNTILGGYFGSRLMANIREDKGYTYGIGAGMVSLKNTGYMSISTEVGSHVCQLALDEIYMEIQRLRKELVPTKELELVRNYMLGSVLKSVDGAFSLASKWKNYLKHGLGRSDHEELIRQIKNITPERIQSLANTYLQKEDLIQVIAGKAP